MNNGRYCDNCETHLDDEDFVSYDFWSYICHSCGFSYRHGSIGVDNQVAKFNNKASDSWDCPDCNHSNDSDYVKCESCGRYLEKESEKE